MFLEATPSNQFRSIACPSSAISFPSWTDGIWSGGTECVSLCSSIIALLKKIDDGPSSKRSRRMVPKGWCHFALLLCSSSPLLIHIPWYVSRVTRNCLQPSKGLCGFSFYFCHCCSGHCSRTRGYENGSGRYACVLSWHDHFCRRLPRQSY
ncbi:NADP-dependent malic enzyme [Fusarium oxysporum f. sp. albedinis]|nr:NADP-dependent malic enzyme [Fusarium oxysporum f. sp. albedinis]